MPPAGKELNCSSGSKPGWSSSHWGSVLGFNVSEECSLSLSLELKRLTQRRRKREIFNIRNIHSAIYTHIYNVTWEPAAGLDSFRTQYPKRQTCGSWDTCTQRKIYSWACATTTSHTLSGTTSHRANCNWAVNSLPESRGLKSSHKPGLCENPGTCLMNYVCHKHWPSGRTADGPRSQKELAKLAAR